MAAPVPMAIVRASAVVPRFKPPVPAWMVVAAAVPAVALPMMSTLATLPVNMLTVWTAAPVPTFQVWAPVPVPMAMVRASLVVERFKPAVPAWMVVAAAVPAVALPMMSTLATLPVNMLTVWTAAPVPTFQVWAPVPVPMAMGRA